MSVCVNVCTLAPNGYVQYELMYSCVEWFIGVSLCSCIRRLCVSILYALLHEIAMCDFTYVILLEIATIFLNESVIFECMYSCKRWQRVNLCTLDEMATCELMHSWWDGNVWTYALLMRWLCMSVQYILFSENVMMAYMYSCMRWLCVIVYTLAWDGYVLAYALLHEVVLFEWIYSCMRLEQTDIRVPVTEVACQSKHFQVIKPHTFSCCTYAVLKYVFSLQVKKPHSTLRYPGSSCTSILECLAYLKVSYSILQGLIVSQSIIQYPTVPYRIQRFLKYPSMSCNVLQCPAVCFSVLQYPTVSTVYYSVW